MLKELHIRNYAIIKEVDIAFNNKLNIITGETGAGKSIVMGALGLILGERADTKSLLNASDKCVIEGVFEINNYTLKPYFDNNELDYDTTCILRREIAPNGKSRAFINDTPVNLNQLKELGSQLVDIVSQHQTLDLNNNDFQLSIVDAIAENNTDLESYKQNFKQYKVVEKQLSELINKEAQAKTDEDYLQFILNELNETNPQENEQELLEKQLEILSNAESIQQSTGVAYSALNTDDQGVIEALRNIKTNLNNDAKHHPSLQELVKRIDSAMIELKDIAAELETITEQTQANPEELERIDSRLQTLFNLQKKHRVTNNTELLAFKTEVEQKLNNIGSLSDDIIKTQQHLQELKHQLSKQSKQLSDNRIKAIPQIEKRVNELLAQVQMADANIKIEHHLLNDNFNTNGIDQIDLLFAANKGSNFQPIGKVASGGELSRLMLCIKSLISDKVALPTIVFDEIDTGISGEAAMKVSNVMKQHAAKHQVIAITHLPQIAGKADTHLLVYKNNDTNTTQTYIKTLSANERVEEIARMLHGENPSEKVLAAAKELIKG
ncbi:MAG: DNA repair protein RecN [Bacteroidia bacterium]|nr:DNA repair protein RecN [Bacteroidia bacterium]